MILGSTEPLSKKPPLQAEWVSGGSMSLICRTVMSIIGTIIILLALAAVVGLIIRSMVKDKKAGKSLHCGQDCSHCGGHCHEK